MAHIPKKVKIQKKKKRGDKNCPHLRIDFFCSPSVPQRAFPAPQSANLLKIHRSDKKSFCARNAPAGRRRSLANSRYGGALTSALNRSLSSAPPTFSCPQKYGKLDYLYRPEILLRSHIGKSADSAGAQKQHAESAAESRDCGLSLNFCAEGILLFSSLRNERLCIPARQMKNARVKIREKFL